VFTDTIHSFQRLHDSRYLNRKPSHLTLVRPDGRQSLQAILGASGVERKLWKQLAVFNALRLDSIPDSSLLMKIVK
jgi:predicted Zn-dependent protease